MVQASEFMHAVFSDSLEATTWRLDNRMDNNELASINDSVCGISLTLQRVVVGLDIRAG